VLLSTFDARVVGEMYCADVEGYKAWKKQWLRYNPAGEPDKKVSVGAHRGDGDQRAEDLNWHEWLAFNRVPLRHKVIVSPKRVKSRKKQMAE